MKRVETTRTIVSSENGRYTTSESKGKFARGIAELSDSQAQADCLLAFVGGAVRNCYFHHRPPLTKGEGQFYPAMANAFIRTLLHATDLSPHRQVEVGRAMLVFHIRPKVLLRYHWLRQAIWDRQHVAGEAFRHMIIADKRYLVDAMFDSHFHLSLFIIELN